MSEPVPNEVDIEPVVIALVQEPIGETVAQHVRVDVLGIPAAEVPILVFVGMDVGFDRSLFDEIPN